MLHRAFSLIEETLPAALLILMVGLIAADVVGRYAFDNPIAGATEVALALFFWQGLLAAAGGSRRRLHIGVTLLDHRLGERDRRVLSIAQDAVTIVLVVFVGVLGWRLALASHVKPIQALRISYFYVNIAMPVAALLMVLHYVANIAATIAGGTPKPIEDSMVLGPNPERPE